MVESLEMLKSRIAKTEKERADALAKAKEYQNKASALTEKATELEVHLRYLKQWTSELEPNYFVHEPKPEKSHQYAGVSARPAVTLRNLVIECLTRLRDFRSQELIAAVQAIRPEANENSIRAELSHSKTRGDIVLLEKDFYRSLTYTEHDESIRGEDIEQVSNKEESDEPESGFGRIAE